jgi:flagellar hook-basal body complex protein FliE
MTGLQESDSDVQNRIKELEDAVNGIRGLAELVDRKKAERDARKILNGARTANNNFRREINTIDDVTQKSVYTRKQKQYADKLDAFDKDMKNQIKPVGKRVQSSEEKAMQGIMGDAGDMTDAGRVMTAAVRAQDDNLAILRRIEGTVATTEEMGNEIAVKLQTDTEKIREIDKELNTLQANLDRAKGEVMWFARQMASDKCFLFIMVFVILGICGLVFYKIYKSRTEGHPAPPSTPAPDITTLAPPPPTTRAPITAEPTDEPTTDAPTDDPTHAPTSVSTIAPTGASTLAPPAATTTQRLAAQAFQVLLHYALS